MTFKVPNQYRLRTGMMGSDDSVGNCGVFEIPIIGLRLLEKIPPSMVSKQDIHSVMFCIVHDGLEPSTRWEHVSCYRYFNFNRYIPSWDEMCLIKSLFWDEEDCVIQYHPPKSQYVNNNPYVLHLWRHLDLEIVLPPRELI